jgi:aminomethyltransferase
MTDLQKTVFYDRHVAIGAKMVEFGGWDMPIQYKPGIVQEHLATRKEAGVFDVSHMGRFRVRGADALAFLQQVLTNNAAALEIGESQYTIVQNVEGGAIDDAYLYRFVEDEYLLVVNASNRDIDWKHLTAAVKSFKSVDLDDRTEDLAMLSLQGPASKNILERIIDSGSLPEPVRNALSIVRINDSDVLIARTGYTGEPICFEIFMPRSSALIIWDILLEQGASPVGLGARDTLRLEAGLPLYGHEFGNDPEGEMIPVFSCLLARVAVSFSPLKGEYPGRAALLKQFNAVKKIINQDYSQIKDLARIIRPVAVTGKGIARAGSKVYSGSVHVGYVTSGTMVPFWKFAGEGVTSTITDDKGMRAVGLAILDSTLEEGDEIDIDVRGKRIKGVVVPYHMRSEAPPYARAILCEAFSAGKTMGEAKKKKADVVELLKKAIENTQWRQQDCINLIPSEQTLSPMTRALSVMDPVGRYAEHKAIRAFCDTEVFYYQGTDFISEIENLLQNELAAFLGCCQVETRLISGQMANMAVYSSLVDHINRTDRKSEQRRIRKVLNHHIIKGGHLSAQPMGALRDYVARDPQTEKAAVVNFPVLPDNPYQIDIESCRDIIAEHRPELIILGKSMTLHKEPVSEIRSMVDSAGIDCTIMYDMAHVLGLIGPHFQQPFREGADVVTGSTHKTFFGTQRGLIAADIDPESARYPFWEAVERRAFPGSVSNHHLGTLLGLLMAAYEMNAFKDNYQTQILANAKAFARALNDCGLSVAGDPGISFTETHQVIVSVGYAQGPKVARCLEENNIIVNYQAAPEEEGFTAAGSLRMGVAEMTRFGMTESDFQELAQMISDVILGNENVKAAVSRFRKRFLDLGYCFSGDEFDGLLQSLQKLI